MSKRHRICMVTDFFYPNCGGVETHVQQLSICLRQRGHSVIIVTHAYLPDFVGVCYPIADDPKLKVYYLPFKPVYNQACMPTVFCTLPLLRYVFIRERITIVHGHSAFSTMALEAIFHAAALGLHTVFTDHSLFGFADASSIITNHILKVSLSVVDHVICVSHTSKENTVLRAALKPHTVSVIPNAIDHERFTPLPAAERPSSKRIGIMVVSRLVYRKGMDLLAGIIPEICTKYSDVDFYIGGDGPKLLLLEEIRDRYQLFDRVHFAGALAHHKVRDHLVKGHIFLNTSLTEAFCMAIIEAASCGLLVVSTRVGGVPEVLPPDLIRLAEPTVEDLVQVLEKAVVDVRKNAIPNPQNAHDRIAKVYQWSDVARRTECVYEITMKNSRLTLRQRLQRYYATGPLSGLFWTFFCAVHFIILAIVEYFIPLDSVFMAPVDESVAFKRSPIRTRKSLSAKK